MPIRQRRGVSLSAVIFWLFAEALFQRLAQILEGQKEIKQELHRIKKSQHEIVSGEEDIMTAVQLQQEDIDEVGTSLENLVDVVNAIDLTPLPEADQTKLIGGLTDLTAALNAKVPPVTPVPTPNPEPGPDGSTPPVDGG